MGLRLLKRRDSQHKDKPVVVGFLDKQWERHEPMMMSPHGPNFHPRLCGS